MNAPGATRCETLDVGTICEILDMSDGWGTLFADKYDMVKDESTGEMIMVDKSAKKHTLDEQGNIKGLDKPQANAEKKNPFAAAFNAQNTGNNSDAILFGAKTQPGQGTGFVFNPPKKHAINATDETPAKRSRTSKVVRRKGDFGSVYVVGNGDCGQLGLGAGDDDVRDTLKPLLVASLDGKRVCQVACGGLHTLALTLDGTIWSWGCNDDEVLGRPGEESEPRLIGGALFGQTVTMVSAGDSHSAALTTDGAVYTWGTYKDANGYIGYLPSVDKAAEPRRVGGALAGRIVSCIASGSDHTAAVIQGGLETYLWGCGEKGQTGLPEGTKWPDDKVAKRAFLEPSHVVTLRLPKPEGYTSLEVLSRTLNENFTDWVGSVLEDNPNHNLSDGCEMYLSHRAALDADVNRGGVIDDRVRVRAIFCGAYHTFLLSETNNVYALGLNNMGQLGLGSLEPEFTSKPLLVAALEGKRIVALDGGEHHSLAVSEKGEVFSFGRGDSSQLGLGDGSDQKLCPTKVENISDMGIMKLSAGSNQNVAISSSAELYTWGFGEMGQLANGKAADEHVPQLVTTRPVADMFVLDAASGGQHSVILAMAAK